MSRTTLTERRPVAEATPVEDGSGRFLVQLLTPGWGASGYYSPQVIEAAGKAKRFPAGLHMSLDHPTATEQAERPEGSVRDLAAVLSEDARWTGDALVAEATVFGPHREVLTQMKDAIGVSIRASAEVEEGEAEGRHGVIVSEIVEGISADFVTHAGRGGRIVDVLESARAKLAEAVSSKPWSQFPDSKFDDEQYARACILDRGEGAGTAKKRYSLPVKEPEGTLNRNACHNAASVLGGGRGGVSASAEQKKAAAKKLVGIYRNQLDEDPPGALLTAADMASEALAPAARTRLREARNIGQWIESRLHLELTQIADDMFGQGRLTREERISLSSAVGSALESFVEALENQAPALYRRDLWSDPEQLAATVGEAIYVPVSPAGQPTTEEQTMPQIEESRLRELEEASGRVSTLESERDDARRERDEARRETATERATTTARTRARTRIGEANTNLHGSVVDRIIAEATREVPLTDKGELDEEKFDKRVDEVRKAEETYLAGLAEANGSGSVHGLGTSTTTTTQESEQLREASDKARRDAFGRKPEKQEA